MTFPDLGTGLYLVVQNGSLDKYYTTKPFLVTISMMNEAGTDWIYDVDASPKVESKPKKPVVTEKSIIVKKVWDAANDKNRPDTVTVELWDGKSLYDSVKLNAKNKWTFTWKKLPASGEWSVKEVNVPKNYKVSYSKQGSTVTVKNTYSPGSKFLI